MSLRSRSQELMTLEQAAIEFQSPIELMLLLLATSSLVRHIDWSSLLQPRIFWHRVLLAAPVLRLYCEKDKMGRNVVELARRAVPMFDLAVAAVNQRVSRSANPRPNELLKSTRTKLKEWSSELEVRHLPNTVRSRLAICETLAPEIFIAWFTVRPDHISAVLLRDPYIPPLRACDFLQALDMAIAQRGRTGPRPTPEQQQIFDRTSSDFHWLIGSSASDYTKSRGPKGIDAFRRKIYGTVGIRAPSTTMLRRKRRK